MVHGSACRRPCSKILDSGFDFHFPDDSEVDVFMYLLAI